MGTNLASMFQHLGTTGEWSTFTRIIASRFQFLFGGDGWFVSLYIYYQIERTNRLVTFSLKEKFTTYDEALTAGLAKAQRWIDEDKPNLTT